MSIIYKMILKSVVQTLRSQYKCPRKSIAGSVLTRHWSKLSRPIVHSVLQELDVQPDHNVLEIGYGRGDGIQMLLDRIGNGHGAAYGLELSPYMCSVASKKFLSKIRGKDQNVFLDYTNEVPVLLPYPNKLFDGIYHVDVFYCWRDRQIKDVLEELWRVLKPGRRLVCGLELSRIRKLEKQNFLRPFEADPFRYLQHLEPVGFTDVKVIYRKIDCSGNETELQGSREIQLIVARKPDMESDHVDPEIVFQKLKEDILDDMVERIMSRSEQAQPQQIRKSISRQNLEKERNVSS